MKKAHLVVDPMTRIEGHLRFETRVENGQVVDAHCSGGDVPGYRSRAHRPRRPGNLLGYPGVVAKAFKSYFKEGKGYGNLLSYAYFPDQNGANHMTAGGATIDGRYTQLDIHKITGDHRYSYYGNQPDKGLRPMDIRRLEPINYERYKQEHAKPGGKYSWARSPRYACQVMEVGPAARVVNTYKAGTNPQLTKLVDRLNQELDISIDDYPSVMGRHLSRYIMSQLIIDRLKRDLALVEPGKLAYEERGVPNQWPQQQHLHSCRPPLYRMCQ